MRIHPAAELFPLMSDAELSELAADISKNGLVDSIAIHDGQVIDGRNRLRACELAGISPRFEAVQLTESPIVYVLSKNLHRRHLTISQRAAIGAEAMDMFREKARVRQLSHLANSSVSFDTDDNPGRSREHVAELVGVGAPTVGRAAAVRESDPEIFEKIKRGEITVNAAYGGHREQPKVGGQIPTTTKSKKGQINANAQKRRMIDGLSVIGGNCWGLGNLDLGLVAACCTAEEIETWATKALSHAKDLRHFAAKLRREEHGKFESGKDGEDKGRSTTDPSLCPEELQQGQG